MCLYQYETLPIVEFTVHIDSLHIELEVIHKSEKLGEDITGGIAVGQTAHRQHVIYVAHAGVECRVGVEGGGSCLGFIGVEAVSLVFVTIVGRRWRSTTFSTCSGRTVSVYSWRSVLPTDLTASRLNLVRRW